VKRFIMKDAALLEAPITWVNRIGLRTVEWHDLIDRRFIVGRW
jgi:hypothetical protein